MYQTQFGQLSNDKLKQIYQNLSSKSYLPPDEKQVLKQVTEIIQKRGLL